MNPDRGIYDGMMQVVERELLARHKATLLNREGSGAAALLAQARGLIRRAVARRPCLWARRASRARATRPLTRSPPNTLA
jgi:hypothetical protein